METVAEAEARRWNEMTEEDFLAKVKHYLDAQDRNGTNQLAFGKAYIGRLYNIAHGKKMDDNSLL
jgi:hypothetical protein